MLNKYKFCLKIQQFIHAYKSTLLLLIRTYRDSWINKHDVGELLMWNPFGRVEYFKSHSKIDTKFLMNSE